MPSGGKAMSNSRAGGSRGQKIFRRNYRLSSGPRRAPCGPSRNRGERPGGAWRPGPRAAAVNCFRQVTGAIQKQCRRPPALPPGGRAAAPPEPGRIRHEWNSSLCVTGIAGRSGGPVTGSIGIPRTRLDGGVASPTWRPR